MQGCSNIQSYISGRLLCIFHLSHSDPYAIWDFGPSHHFVGGILWKIRGKIIGQMNQNYPNKGHLTKAGLSNFHMYTPGSLDPLFQAKVGSKFHFMTNSKVSQILALLN